MPSSAPALPAVSTVPCEPWSRQVHAAFTAKRMEDVLRIVSRMPYLVSQLPSEPWADSLKAQLYPKGLTAEMIEKARQVD